MHDNRLFFLVVFITLINITGAKAASSEWHDLGGGEARLVAAADPASSTINGLIEVRLQEGWSTYWRYPGSSGIPPKFDFSASMGFSNQPVEFPTPSLQSANDVTYAGYKKHVSFPFTGIGKLSSETHSRVFQPDDFFIFII